MKNIYNEEVKDKTVSYNTDTSKSIEKKTSNKKIYNFYDSVISWIIYSIFNNNLFCIDGNEIIYSAY